MLAISEPKFVGDVNVGRLATWLRVMGYDALFLFHAEDNELVRIALRENRIIVTKDTGLAQRRLVTTGRLKVVLVQCDDFRGQIRHLIDCLGLDDHTEFSRCILCNEPLLEFPKESVKGQVPPYVFDSQNEFMWCTLCARIYWRGTHWANMHSELVQIRGGAP